MNKLALMFAGLAGLIHSFIFLGESVWWTRPKVYKMFQLNNDYEAKLTSHLAFNQGFYNLFLAFGIVIGLSLIGMGYAGSGYAILTYTCVYMMGASLVLLFSNPKMILGVVVQGLPPLVYLAALILKNSGRG